MPSAFRHPQVRYRIGSPYSGAGLVQASEFLFIPVPDSPTFRHWKKLLVVMKRNTQCTSKLQVVERDTLSTSIHGCWWFYSCYMILKIICKCRRKVSPASAFLPVPEIIDPVFAKTSQNDRFLLSENERFGLVFVKTGSINSGTVVRCLSPASAFRHQSSVRTLAKD
jgi:hypothetical protein